MAAGKGQNRRQEIEEQRQAHQQQGDALGLAGQNLLAA